jgi:hypothetical protein
MDRRAAGAQFIELTIKSIKDPRAALREILSLNISLSNVFQAAFLTAVVNVLLIELTLFFSPAEARETMPFLVPSIPMHLFLQFIGVVIVGYLMFIVGRVFHGIGSLKDCLIAVVWLQIVILALQILSTLIGLVLPFAGALIVVAAFGLLFYLFTKFIMEVHDFKSEILVFGSMIATVFVVAFILSIVLVTLGITLDVPAPNMDAS